MRFLGMLATALLVTAAGCGGEPLKERDPRGAEACAALVQASRYSGDSEILIGSLIEAGKAAEKAKTSAIKKAVTQTGLEDFPIADSKAMAKACRDEGVKVPKMKSEEK